MPLSPDLKQSELLQQIHDAWQRAREDLEVLREDVVRASEMARMSANSSSLARRRELALRDLGEAVWNLVQKEKIELPIGLGENVKAVRLAEENWRSHARDIRALLEEGEEAAERLQLKPRPRPRNAVAPKGKKR